MTQKEFREEHRSLQFKRRENYFSNPLPSATDPTQDVPVCKIDLSPMGVPLNVRPRNFPYSNQGVESLQTIDRRNNDAFDAVGELQSLERHAKSITQ